MYFFICIQKTVYEMRISYWSSDLCSSDLKMGVVPNGLPGLGFSFAENFHYSAASEPMKEISFANVIGIHTSPYTTTWKNPMQLFVIVFKPLGDRKSVV